MKELRNAYKTVVGQSQAKIPLEISWRRWGIILNLNLRKWCVSVWTGFMFLRIELIGGLL
jgi:hypothetical protein